MRYSTTTSASSARIIELARGSFGPDGSGLRMTSVGLTEVRFDAESGFVAITIARHGGENEVVIETREFDDDVIRYMSTLPRHSLWSQLFRRWRSKR